MRQPTALVRLLEHSERLLELVEQADLETLAGALHATLGERDRLTRTFSEERAAGLEVTPAEREILEATDRKIAQALARRREEARVALTALQSRPASFRPTSPPPPRFLDQKG